MNGYNDMLKLFHNVFDSSKLDYKSCTMFRNTDIKLALARPEQQKKVMYHRLQPRNIRRSNLRLTFQPKNIESCYAEWKSMATLNDMLMKQCVKNLCVNKCILFELSDLLDDNDIGILGMD
ncbi:hypothetical protein RO3G_00582 [Rhizopus delemar RA 99-880]|uniref:Uncharacterized protein n=1 Tax=Rhizopus delemar (strain RA 99-880 / ATCC MYA-4621 / FGSC 9543 / NRRL 43880) TaxID=246409 RepID=I1BI48_RHIO9|nr:hypothetical protein RO3G_00582 [Rhizopus delemar RA 99-880]|eukprot:EIE75878.1 hypothetical protein RO3G_00582 [Rhizopus delemar RA 99-880]